jgi:hypothetical protein
MSNTDSAVLPRSLQYWPNARRLGFDSPQDEDDLSVHHWIQKVCRAHSASCPMGTSVIYQGVIVLTTIHR